MSNLDQQLALMRRLPRTWPAFLARYGSFTNVQLNAIPALLDGENLILCGPTASGKTEAALAPLIERHCPPAHRPAGLRILYLTPTRALAADLYERLRHPIESLGLRLALKVGDRSSFRVAHPPDLLITTPESADSLIVSHARLLARLSALVVDELHLLDDTPRGDQLRVVLRRIRQIRAYAATQQPGGKAIIQYVALSATLAAPEAAAARYFGAASVLVAPGQRQTEAELIALSPVTSDELLRYLAGFRARGWRKALVFCNSRAEVEAYAADLRAGSPFGSAVFVHYSNIEASRRREIEQMYAASESAICFASSTLELGIDIGDIDVVALIGPPGSQAAFAQRAGRAGRRSGRIRIACFYRTELELLMFEALLGAEQPEGATPTRPPAQQAFPFRPAVAIQQIFSLLKQSPIAALRLAELSELFDGLLTRADLAGILGELEQRGYLRPGRPGEWRSGDQLNELIDRQASARPDLSIHSNIQGSPARLLNVRDQQTQRVIAQVDPLWLGRETLTLEGRQLDVEWHAGEVLLVRSTRPAEDRARPVFVRSGRQLLSYELAQRLPARLGLSGGAAPLLPADGGWIWFHWLGELYGRALLDLVRYRIPTEDTGQIGLAIKIGESPPMQLDWGEVQIRQYLEDNLRTYEPLLDLGPFERLLPMHLRYRAIVERFDIARFQAAVGGLRPAPAQEALAARLAELLE